MAEYIVIFEWVKACLLIPPWTKWPPFRRRYFQMHFSESNVLYFDWNFTTFCTQVSNKQLPIIGLDNRFAPNMRQAIIWSNADLIHWHIYAPGKDQLKPIARQSAVVIYNIIAIGLVVNNTVKSKLKGHDWYLCSFLNVPYVIHLIVYSLLVTVVLGLGNLVHNRVFDWGIPIWASATLSMVMWILFITYTKQVIDWLHILPHD